MSMVSLPFCSPAWGSRLLNSMEEAGRLAVCQEMGDCCGGDVFIHKRHNSSSSAAESLPITCGMRIAIGEAAELSLCHFAELGISGCPVTLCHMSHEDKPAALMPSSPSLQSCQSPVPLCCCFSLFLCLCCAVGCFCSGGGLPLTFRFKTKGENSRKCLQIAVELGR